MRPCGNYNNEGEVDPVGTDLGSTKIVEHEQNEHGGYDEWTGGHGQRSFDDAPKGSSQRKAPKPKRAKPDVDAGELSEDAW